jgi:hypothetical protein
MKELIARIESDNGSDFVEFKSPADSVIVIDRDMAAASHQQILDIYKVPSDRSADLKP